VASSIHRLLGYVQAGAVMSFVDICVLPVESATPRMKNGSTVIDSRCGGGKRQAVVM
jgi:hypothetical protein